MNADQIKELQPLFKGEHVVVLDAVAFGVVTGSVDAPDMVPLIPALPVTDELLALAAPVSPGEVFRFAAKCIKDGCRHWEGETQRCRLVAKTVQLAPGASVAPAQLSAVLLKSVPVRVAVWATRVASA